MFNDDKDEQRDIADDSIAELLNKEVHNENCDQCETIDIKQEKLLHMKAHLPLRKQYAV
jgi:hypothetical protein